MINFVINAVINIVMSLIPMVGTTIGATLSTPIGVIGYTLLYYDLRVRKQGYTHEVLAGELGVELDSRTV